MRSWFKKISRLNRRRAGAVCRLRAACRPECQWLESRVLLSTFKLFVASERRTAPGSATTLDIYSTGEALSTVTVTWPDAHVDHPTVTTPITTDTYTISSGFTGEQTVTVTATSTLSHNATATWALDSDFGNFPGSGGGEYVFTPANATTATNYGVLVDTAHSDNVYSFESATPSGGTSEFAITKTSNTGVLDTNWGDSSGGSHTGTLTISSFDGGTDVPYGATIYGSTMWIVGKAANGWAIGSVNLTNPGSATTYSSPVSGGFDASAQGAVTVDPVLRHRHRPRYSPFLTG